MTRAVLIVEDDTNLAAAMEIACERAGLRAATCSAGRLVRPRLEEASWDAVVLDLGLPDMSGLRVLEELRRDRPTLPVVIVTAHGTLENAMAARRLGIEAFLVKPVDHTAFAATLKELTGPSRAVEPAPSPSGAMLVGSSPPMQRAMVRLAQACASDAPVLIVGPTGSGKTLAAQLIHTHGLRPAGPFVTLSCGALPENLLESELFGHERGAFTGAVSARAGHIERAAGGTLLLDEIGDVSPAVQTRLLRLIDERVYSRVGGREDLRLDARIVAATHRNLGDEVRAGRFREDLLFRLRVIEVDMPPLRDRMADLPLLCAFLLAGIAPGRDLRLADEARQALERHDWPGNIRELRNALESAAATAPGQIILSQHLPPAVTGAARKPDEAAALRAAVRAWIAARLAEGADYDALLNGLEKTLLDELLPRYRHQPSVLARELRVHRATLLGKRRRLGLG
jgi:DNA-binding NtrC family response regulator